MDILTTPLVLSLILLAIVGWAGKRVTANWLTVLGVAALWVAILIIGHVISVSVHWDQWTVPIFHF